MSQDELSGRRIIDAIEIWVWLWLTVSLVLTANKVHSILVIS